MWVINYNLWRLTYSWLGLAGKGGKINQVRPDFGSLLFDKTRRYASRLFAFVHTHTFVCLGRGRHMNILLNWFVIHTWIINQAPPTDVCGDRFCRHLIYHFTRRDPRSARRFWSLSPFAALQPTRWYPPPLKNPPPHCDGSADLNCKYMEAHNRAAFSSGKLNYHGFACSAFEYFCDVAVCLGACGRSYFLK